MILRTQFFNGIRCTVIWTLKMQGIENFIPVNIKERVRIY